MNECLTLCILAEPGLQNIAPIYFDLVLLLLGTLTASVFLARKAPQTTRHINTISPHKILSSKKTQLCLVLMLQIIVLTSFQAKYAQVVKTGKTIALAATPLDPFDFFRGNYQALNFSEGRLSSKKVRFHMLNNIGKDSTVYVVFQPDGELWKATDVYETKPVLTLQSVVMKGRIDYLAGDTLALHYGIEQYFFAEGKGVNLTKGAKAIVRVDKNGDAVLTDLIASTQSATH
jgi:uncharacterized membrane-anchored protein